jgi:thiol-disulfide isomerase/thioredoxin
MTSNFSRFPYIILATIKQLPMRHFCILSGLFLALLATSSGCQKGWQQIALQDMAEQEVRLSKFRRGPVQVVVFLGSECPISQKYVPVLNELTKRFPEADFVGMFTKWDELPAVFDFKNEYQPVFPLLRDPKLRLAKLLGAVHTPEVFILKNDTVHYRGAIDNWFADLGKFRPAPTEHYLTDALKAAFEGKPAAVQKTKAVGCKIEY